LTADQVTAEHEEEVDANPTETMDAAGKRETEKGSVVEDHQDNRERAEEIQTGLTFAMRKARIDRVFGHRKINAT